MISCLQTRVHKQPITALYFESENEQLGGHFEIKVVHVTTELLFFCTIYADVISVLCINCVDLVLNQNYIHYCMNYVSEGAN